MSKKRLTDLDLANVLLQDKDDLIAELKQQLAEKDKQIESLKNQFEKEACNNLDWEGKCLCLYSILYETLEKLDPAPNDIASAIQQMTNENFDKQNDQFKTISVCKELMRQVEQKDDVIKQFKEKVEEEADFKEEYYHYWQDAKKEIEEKEKEIARLKKERRIDLKEFDETQDEYEKMLDNKNREINELKRQLKNSRHQICEKIKANSPVYTAKIKGTPYTVVKMNDLKYILDQIEKGEKKC